MKRTVRHALLWCVILYTYTHTAIIIQGDDQCAPYGFTQPVTAKVLKKSTGTIFVGVDAPDNNQYAISKAGRPISNTTPKFVPIATDTNFPDNASIEFLALSEPANCPCILPFVIQANNALFEATHIAAIFEDGSSYVESDDLNDAAENLTAGIVQLEANSAYAFAAVRPDGGYFGDEDSGIALVNIVCCKEFSAATIDLITKDATTGQNGNRAQELDFNTAVLTDGTNDVQFLSDPDDINKVAMYWDNVFARLYVGVRVETDTSLIAKAVTVGRIGTGLVLENIVANAAVTPGADDEIVVTGTGPVAIKYIRTMHASTGPSYLIVNGGNGFSDQVGNLIFALPLVDDSGSPSLHGTLADKDAPLTNFKFTVPATMPGDLATEDEPAAIVGTCPLPILPEEMISDINVVGDAVYVSISDDSAPSSTGSYGIFYSQAEFSADGKIARWTPWVRRAAPFNAFPGVLLPGNLTDNGSVNFFEVDAKTGNICLVEGTTGQVVGVTTWATSSVPGSLVNTLNTKLTCGSYSVLDLHQATRGFLDGTINRYALFGGANKVVFLRTSISQDIADVCAEQEVITNFTSEQNCLETQLPGTPGCVNVLEYSRTSTQEGDANYFFAGTQKGLYVFADNTGNGFNVAALGTLDQYPFNGAWRKIDTISGAIVDLEILGENLFVLTYEVDCKNNIPLKNKVLSIPLADNIATMFDSANIFTIAETGVAPFDNQLMFTGIELVATSTCTANDPSDKTQLVLTTNKGLFVSAANQSLDNTGIPDAQNATEAAWELVTPNDTSMYSNIFGMETPIPHTVWPISVEDQKNCKTYDRSSVHQTNACGDSDGDFDINNVPEFFNAEDSALTAFKTLNPIFYFFSDGGRRFFIFNSICNPPTQTKIGVIPFDTQIWRVEQSTILNNALLTTIARFLWISPIGATGILLAGTNTGVVGLL